MGRISDFRSLRVPDSSVSGNLFFRPEPNKPNFLTPPFTFQLLPVRVRDEEERSTRWILFASKCRAFPRGVTRKHRTWGIRHLAGSIRDVGFGDRRESVAGARCTCGFGDTWAKIQVSRGTSTSVGAVSARHGQVRVLQRAARICLRCA
jgi:hypothetical protein